MCLPSVYGRTKKKDNYSLLLDIVNEMDITFTALFLILWISVIRNNYLDFSYKK